MFKQRPASTRLNREPLVAGLFWATFLFVCQTAGPAMAKHDQFLFGEPPDVKVWARDLPGEGSIARTPLLQEQRQAIFALYLAPVLLGKTDGLTRVELARRARSALALLPDLSTIAKKQAKGNRARSKAAPAAGGTGPGLGDSLRFLRWRLDYFASDKSKVIAQVKEYLAKHNAEAAKQGSLICGDLLALSLDFGRQERYLDENNLLQFSHYLTAVKASEVASQADLNAVKDYELHVAQAYAMAQLDRREEASEHFSQAINYLRPRPVAQRPQTDGLRKALLRVVDEDLLKYENELTKNEHELIKNENDPTKYENELIKYNNIEPLPDVEKRALLVLNESDRKQFKRDIGLLTDIAYLAKIDGRLTEATYLFRRAFLLVKAYLPTEQKDYSSLCYDLGETLLWDEKFDDSVYYLSYCVELRSKDNPLAVTAIDTNNLLGRARLSQGQAKKAQDIFFDNLARVAKRARLRNIYFSTKVKTSTGTDLRTDTGTDAKTSTGTDLNINAGSDAKTSKGIDERAHAVSGAARSGLIQALLAYFPTAGADERRQIDDGFQGTIDAALPLKQYDLAIEGGEALLKLRSQAVPANDAGMMSVLWGLAYTCDSCARPGQAIKYYNQMIDSYGTIAPTSLAYWYHGRGLDYDLVSKHDQAAVDVKRAIRLYQDKLKLEEDEESRDHLAWTIADLKYNLQMADKYPASRPDYASLPDNCRWRLASFPLKIYVDSGKERGFGGELNNLVREAVAIWRDYDGSPIKVEYVDKLSEADIFIERVTVYDDIPYGSAGRTSATYERKGEVETKILTRTHVRIYCPSFDGNDWENQDVKMSSFAKIQFKYLLVHELGHVFGLAHSPAGPDIMYWKSCAQKLSDRDMNTVKKIYKDGVPKK